jgi:3-oxoacyl-[acyl-carrier-protein] synthase III
MNNQEKEQVNRIIRKIAEYRSRNEITDIAKGKINAKIKKLEQNKDYQDLLSEYKSNEKKKMAYHRATDRIEKALNKLAERNGLNFSTYNKPKLEQSAYDIEQELRAKLDNKKDEIILKVLTAGNTTKAMAIINEFKQFNLI